MQELSAIKSSLEKMEDGTNGMWIGRAVVLLDVIDGTSVDFNSANLLDDLELEATVNSKVADYLQHLPGYPADRQCATRQLGFLSDCLKEATFRVH